MKGSKKSILSLIDSDDFLERVNTLINVTGVVVKSEDIWQPKGYIDKREAQLKSFLAKNFEPCLREEIQKWWLVEKISTSTTPNWDLISTCTINGDKGILLVEGKAHYGELDYEKKGKRINKESSNLNHERIRYAIKEANDSIRGIAPDISISIDYCYQFSNRVAHAWWLAKHGIPTVLLYLGFLNVNEMNYGKRRVLETASDWQNCFFEHAQKVGAEKIIDKWINCGKSSFITICKSI